MPKAGLIKTKGKCCTSRPRCKRCPVACKRLEKQSLAERLSKRRYLVDTAITKRDWKAARAR